MLTAATGNKISTKRPAKACLISLSLSFNSRKYVPHSWRNWMHAWNSSIGCICKHIGIYTHSFKRQAVWNPQILLPIIISKTSRVHPVSNRLHITHVKANTDYLHAKKLHSHKQADYALSGMLRLLLVAQLPQLMHKPFLNSLKPISNKTLAQCFS